MSTPVDLELTEDAEDNTNDAFERFLAGLTASMEARSGATGAAVDSAFADTVPINTGNPYAKPFKEKFVPLQADRATAPWQCGLDRAIVLISFGLYAPWARSFLLNTTAKTILFSGARFGDRLAPGLRLRGRLVLAGLVLVAQLGVFAGGVFGALLIAVSAAALPALVWNIQVTRAWQLYFAGRAFHHVGSLAQAAVSYAWLPAAWCVAAWLQVAWLTDASKALPLFFAALLLALAPLAHALHRRYAINAIAWHGAGFSYEAPFWRFYIAWAAALPGIALALAAGFAGWQWFNDQSALVAHLADLRGWLRGHPASLPMTVLAATAAWLAAAGAAWWLYRALIAPILQPFVVNTVANHTAFLANHLHLHWRPADVALHQATNAIAMIATLGIAAGWVHWRWTRFCAAHMSVTVLDHFKLPVESLHDAKRGWIGW
jgi:uncharacterized membrane protein YjgN (DUF898 family)